MNQLILFDIDLTLINTDLLKKLQIKSLALKLNTTEEKVLEVGKSYFRTLKSSVDFKPEGMTSHLSREFEFKQEKLLKVFYSKRSDYRKSLFKDTTRVLKELSSHYPLGIFSEGHKKFQLTKLKFSNIYKYFSQDHIYIFKRKGTEKALDQIPPKSIIVEDRKEHVGKIARHGDLIPIWLNRKDEKMNKSITTINKLSNLIKIV